MLRLLCKTHIHHAVKWTLHLMNKNNFCLISVPILTKFPYN